MKTLFIFAFALIVCSTLATCTGYIKLRTSTIEKSQLIQDLLELGADYTLEKGIFQQKPTLPNGFWVTRKTESVYKRVKNGITYYKYTVQLFCFTEPYLIRAKYTVAFRKSNGDTLVTSYSYSVIDPNPHEEAIDAPGFIDNRLVKKGSDLKKYLDKGIEYIVKAAIEVGNMKKSTYSFVRLFSVKDLGSKSPPGYVFKVQLVSKEGYNYRVLIIVYAIDDLENNYYLRPAYIIDPNTDI